MTAFDCPGAFSDYDGQGCARGLCSLCELDAAGHNFDPSSARLTRSARSLRRCVMPVDTGRVRPCSVCGATTLCSVESADPCGLLRPDGIGFLCIRPAGHTGSHRATCTSPTATTSAEPASRPADAKRQEPT